MRQERSATVAAKPVPYEALGERCDFSSVSGRKRHYGWQSNASHTEMFPQYEAKRIHLSEDPDEPTFLTKGYFRTNSYLQNPHRVNRKRQLILSTPQDDSPVANKRCALEDDVIATDHNNTEALYATETEPCGPTECTDGSNFDLFVRGEESGSSCSNNIYEIDVDLREESASASSILEAPSLEPSIEIEELGTDAGKAEDSSCIALGGSPQSGAVVPTIQAPFPLGVGQQYIRELLSSSGPVRIVGLRVPQVRELQRLLRSLRLTPETGFECKVRLFRTYQYSSGVLVEECTSEEGSIESEGSASCAEGAEKCEGRYEVEVSYKAPSEVVDARDYGFTDNLALGWPTQPDQDRFVELPPENENEGCDCNDVEMI